MFLLNFSFDQIIQLATTTIAIITSLVSVFTLRILVKQRKGTFRPQIVIGDKLIGVCSVINGNQLKTRWLEKYPEVGFEDVDLSFDILNVGVGVAENVTVNDYFDVERAVKLIEKMDVENDFIFERIENDIIEVKTTFDNSYQLIFKRDEPRQLGTFIVREQLNPFKYVFTDSYLVVLSCFNYLKAKYNSNLSLSELPNCVYEIEYSDIEGKIYKSKYVCVPDTNCLDEYKFYFNKE